MLKGCDLSKWNPVTPSGYDFYLIKASEGNGYKDSALDTHFNAVKSAGKLYGFYHYARPDLGNTPEAEADWFLSLVGQHAGNAIFALDYEGDSLSKLYGFYHYARPDLGNTPEAEADWFLSLVGQHAGNAIFALDYEGDSLSYGQEWALRWLQRVYEKTGVRPVFYCSSSALPMFEKIGKENFGLWVANWNVESPKIEPWSVFAFWQYTNRPIDQDYFNGTIEQYKKYCKSDKKPEHPKKSLNEIASEVINGKWGNGNDRKTRLEQAGYDYESVQAIVNARLNQKEPTYQTALEVLRGKYGNGNERRTKLRNAAGYDYESVQAIVNARLNQKEPTYQTALEVLRGKYGNGNERRTKLRNAGYDYEKTQAVVNRLTTIATETIRGRYGNGQTRINALRRMGYDPNIVQEAVNILMQ